MIKEKNKSKNQSKGLLSNIRTYEEFEKSMKNSEFKKKYQKLFEEENNKEK